MERSRQNGGFIQLPVTLTRDLCLGITQAILPSIQHTRSVESITLVGIPVREIKKKKRKKKKEEKQEQDHTLTSVIRKAHWA
jgi:hypothetical protein